GLLDAARSYDEDRGPFAAWASLCIRNAMMEGARRWSGQPRRIVRERTGTVAATSFASPHQDAHVPTPTPQKNREAAPAARSWARFQGEPDALATRDASPEEGLVRGELRAFVREAIARLPPKEREALNGYYYGDRRLKEIAAAAGVTESGAARML